MAAILAAVITPVAANAASNDELAAEIKELKAQIHAMQGAISQNRNETRRTNQKIKAVASRGPAPYVAGPGQAIPVDATPVFVTASKQLQFGALTITPGGYFAGESVYRTRTLNSDIGTNFGSVGPYTSASSHTDEFRPSARASRAALLLEAPITPRFLVSGYGEFDFFGAAQTANSAQSNSYQPRIRHLYAQLDDTEGGYHFLAGQAYSLLTLNSKGITPRNEVTPTTIDNNQTIGSIYARQAQVRLTKDFDKKLWFAISAEEADTTYTTCSNNSFFPTSATAVTPVTSVPVPGATANCGAVGSVGNSNGTVYSFNHVPDVVAKAAYETSLAGHDLHLEGFGLYTNLYDRVQSLNAGGAVISGTNQSTNGYGFGGGFIASVIPKKLDLQGNAIYGRGIGRYAPTQLNDASFNTNGSLNALPEVIALAGATLHATPSIDLYAYAGIEQGFRSYTGAGTTASPYYGVGAPNVVDTGCYTEGAASTTCSGSTKRAIELTGGMWDKLYKGSFGEVRVGLQYAYLQRELFNGNLGGTGAGAALASPKFNDQEVFTSFRYYPFQ